jgi:hypothetical protein
MAGEDQEQNAEAHVAMSPLSDFFANTPATCKAHTHEPTSTDIIPQCTIAVARNNGDPYTEMKDAILQFTTKPK